MGMILHSVFVLLGVLTSIVLVQTQEQPGFISIDCGLPENAAYTEKSTGINYISDAKFINTGVSKSVSPEDRGTYQQQFDYLRSFPSGVRNCYRINVTSGARYLIRASFLYGNYDGLNELPQFDLHLGANLWDTVKFKNASLSINNELIHSVSLDYIHICLVNTDNGIPFISTIELRILNDIIDYSSTQPTISLARFLRLDFGSITNLTYRYKDDLYDRLWEPYSDKQWTHISSPLRDNDLLQDKFLLPAAVMSTAATPIKASASLDFNWDADSVTNRYYFYLHFTEVQNLPANETRSFNIFLNGKFWYGPVVPQYRTTYTKYPLAAWYGYDKYQISLVQTESSPLPPIISALEVYSVKDFSQFETEKDDVDAITNIKIAYSVTKNWQGDPCAPVAYKWEGLECSFDGAPRITSLNLSSSGLTGHIEFYISKLTKLKSLDLSNNSLRGVVPYFLVELPSLKVLNLENNNLTGSVPTELVERSDDGLLSLRFDGKPNLYTPNPLHKRNKVLIPLVVTLVGIFILSATTLCFFRSRLEVIVMSMKKFSGSINIEHVDSSKQEFTYSEILSITNNFEKVVGKGGFGTVYYGCIGETQVAVKMLFPSAQGHLQFHTESEILTRVHHRCLTPFIGYCNEGTKQALVYEYMTNGNLAAYLSGLKSYYTYSHEAYPGSCDQGIPTKTFLQYGLVDKSKKLLGWKQRLQIALDSALGLEYLHNGCKPPIIHRDIKTRNILLNEQFCGKISDFGLSRIFPDECVTHVSTVIAGTPGYVDPEYYITNRLNEKSDVFSFGVVLLEIITGRAAILNTEERIHIIQWVNSLLADKGEIDSIMDPRLQGEYDTEIARKFVDVAMACVALRSINRPTMNQVVLELQRCLPWENLGSTSHGSIDIASVGAISGESSLVR